MGKTNQGDVMQLEFAGPVDDPGQTHPDRIKGVPRAQWCRVLSRVQNVFGYRVVAIQIGTDNVESGKPRKHSGAGVVNMSGKPFNPMLRAMLPRVICYCSQQPVQDNVASRRIVGKRNAPQSLP